MSKELSGRKKKTHTHTHTHTLFENIRIASLLPGSLVKGRALSLGMIGIAMFGANFNLVTRVR